MNGYFKPLRRKSGVLTLVIACVFAAGWVRSLITRDWIDRSNRILLSSDGQIEYLIRVVTYDEEGSDTQVPTILAIPYWSIVIPLTLLSAWLLLGQPRAKAIDAIVKGPRVESLS